MWEALELILALALAFLTGLCSVICVAGGSVLAGILMYACFIAATIIATLEFLDHIDRRK